MANWNIWLQYHSTHNSRLCYCSNNKPLIRFSISLALAKEMTAEVTCLFQVHLLRLHSVHHVPSILHYQQSCKKRFSQAESWSEGDMDEAAVKWQWHMAQVRQQPLSDTTEVFRSLDTSVKLVYLDEQRQWSDYNMINMLKLSAH